MPYKKGQNLKRKTCLLKIQLNKKRYSQELVSTPISLQLSNGPAENDWVANLTGNMKEMLTFITAQSLKFFVPAALVKQQPASRTAATNDLLAGMDASDVRVSQSCSKKPTRRNYTWG